MFLVYNSDANSQDIVTFSDKLAKTDSVSFPIEEKTLYANEALRTIWSWIFQAYGGWIFDDKNQTDLPTATGNLVLGQSDYALPQGISSVLGVEVLNQDNTWDKLDPITLEQILESGSESEFLSTNSQPRYYRLVGNSLKIYPAANYSQNSSIRLHLNRDISAFAVTDTTKTPGFDSLYHEAVPLFMALKKCKIDSLPIKSDWQMDWDGDENRTGREGGYKKRIKEDYQKKFAQLFPGRMTVRDAVAEFA